MTENIQCSRSAFKSLQEGESVFRVIGHLDITALHPGPPMIPGTSDPPTPFRTPHALLPSSPLRSGVPHASPQPSSLPGTALAIPWVQFLIPPGAQPLLFSLLGRTRSSRPYIPWLVPSHSRAPCLPCLGLHLGPGKTLASVGPAVLLARLPGKPVAPPRASCPLFPHVWAADRVPRGVCLAPPAAPDLRCPWVLTGPGGSSLMSQVVSLFLKPAPHPALQIPVSSACLTISDTLWTLSVAPRCPENKA